MYEAAKANISGSERKTAVCYYGKKLSFDRVFYLVDALDDLEKDFKKKSYNPFISCFGDFTSPKTFVKDHLDDLEFIFYTTLNKIAESYNDLELQKYTCVLRNVLHIAIRDTTQKVFDKYLEENKQSEQSV